MYVLTARGREIVDDYIRNCAAKRKEILDARKDTADETYLPTVEGILSDLNFGVGVDEEGDYFNGWGVTDHYNADDVLGLRIGEDLWKFRNQLRLPETAKNNQQQIKTAKKLSEAKGEKNGRKSEKRRTETNRPRVLTQLRTDGSGPGAVHDGRQAILFRTPEPDL